MREHRLYSLGEEETMDLRPEALYKDSTVVDLSARVRGSLSSDTSRRAIAHTIADLADSLVRHPGMDVETIIITVHRPSPTLESPRPDIVVTGTASLQTS